jgi:hypothetical protein
LKNFITSVEDTAKGVSAFLPETWTNVNNQDLTWAKFLTLEVAVGIP